MKKSARPEQKFLDDLLARARRVGETSVPRKHHLVPRFYLQRWATDNKLRATDVDADKSHLTSPLSAARWTDFYRVESDDLDSSTIPPLLFETLLGEVETAAKTAIDSLLETGIVEGKLRAELATFLAFQLTRGQRFREALDEQTAESFRIMYENVTDAGIVHLLNERGLPVTPSAIADARKFIDGIRDGSIFVQQQKAATIGMSVAMVEHVAPYVFGRAWRLYRTPPILVTCDEPVVLIGGPGHKRTERGGVGSVGVVAFPVGPGEVLVMFHPDMPAPSRPFELDHIETADLNLEIISNATRWAFERPERAITTRMKVPALGSHTVWETPSPVIGRPDSRVIRASASTRWANADVVPPWPVTRWWRR